MTRRAVASTLLLAVCSWGCGDSDEAGQEPEGPCQPRVQKLPEPTRYTPRWAFEPWISKDISDGPDTYAFVDGFISRDIPVGVVVLDSPWETNYNSLIPNPERYPDFEKMVADMSDRGVRVVLWTTQMINYNSFDLEPGGDAYDGPSPNLQEGLDCGYFVQDGDPFAWWKGQGAALDFFNPRAAEWWHRQQKPLFDMGVSGFKLDFGEEYITQDPMQTAEGPISKQEYSERYYQDFLKYGQFTRGRDDFVTMVRPYDESYGFPGRFFARPEHAPVAWVGDNRRDWLGLEDALDHIFRSARAGYVVVGSDLGGYLNVNDLNVLEEVPFSQETFARWTGVAAMTPFMQLHGRANLTPWTMPVRADETVSLYRYWAQLHHEMVPFWYSLAESAYAGGPVPLEPVGEEKDWAGDYRYLIGDAFLVAPILDDSGVRDVALPSGSRWLDWWALTAAPHDGGQTLPKVDVTTQARIPMYLKEGAIVPLEVTGALTGFGTDASRDTAMILLWPGPTQTEFTLYDADDETTRIEIKTGSVTLSRAIAPVTLQIRVDSAPSSVSLDQAALSASADRDALSKAESGYWVDPSGRLVFVKLPKSDAPRSVVLQ